MKKLFLGIFFLVGILVLNGCGDKAANGKIEINFWELSPVGSPSYSGMKAIITDFNDSQDKYYVKGSGFSFWDYWDKLGVAIASKTAPDIGLNTIDDVVTRAQSDAVYNLSDFIQADKDAGLGDFDFAPFYQNQLDISSYQGSLFAMPFTSTTRVLYYNKDMFAKAGLTDADVPKTWSELATVAKKLDIVKNGEIQQLGFDPTYGQGTYMGYLWQSGLDFFDQDLNPTLNTQQYVDILNWMLDFNNDFSRTQLNSFGDASSMLGTDPFSSKRVAMYIDTDGLYQTLSAAGSDVNYGVVPIPVPDDNGIRINWGSGFSIELFTNGKGVTEKSKGAWEFMKYLMSDDTQVKLANANGWIMANKDAMAEVAQGNEVLTALVNEVPYAVDKVYVPYAPNWHAADWQQFYDEALDGTKTAQQTLDLARAYYLEKQTNYNELHK